MYTEAMNNTNLWVPHFWRTERCQNYEEEKLDNFGGQSDPFEIALLPQTILELFPTPLKLDSNFAESSNDGK
jgi:hypothetical protein